LRGATWRFWGNKKGDFYVAARVLGGDFKTSLHKDGWCQIGATKELLRRWPGHSLPRKMDRWQLPDAPMALAFEIATPGDELTQFQQDEKQPMLWLQPPSPSFIVVVSILIWRTGERFTAPELLPGDAENAGIIGGMETKSRSSLAIYRSYPLTEATRKVIDESRAKLRALMPREVQPTSGARMILIGSRDKGQRFFLDLAL
jgi:hypothetical protein